MVFRLMAEQKDEDDHKNWCDQESSKTEASKDNKVAIKDAQEAQQAVAQATSVLETFYKESGMIEKKSYELLQKEPVELPETPSTWDASYTGVTDPTEQPEGIIAVLKK